MMPNLPQGVGLADANKKVIPVSCAGLLLEFHEVSCHGDPVVRVLLSVPMIQGKNTLTVVSVA